LNASVYFLNLLANIFFMTKPLKPGQTTPTSGQYQVIGPKGGKGPEITSTKGNPLPPAPTPKSTYKLVDPTKHKGK
jgi:hypothetical protein